MCAHYCSTFMILNEIISIRYHRLAPLQAHPLKTASRSPVKPQLFRLLQVRVLRFRLSLIHQSWFESIHHPRTREAKRTQRRHLTPSKQKSHLQRICQPQQTAVHQTPQHDLRRL